MTDPFARFGAAMVRWRWLVLALWLVVLGVSGGVLAPRASEVVKGGGFDLPDSDSGQAAERLTTDFGASVKNSIVVVFRSPDRTVDDPGFRDEVTRAAERLTTVHGARSVFTFFNSGDPALVSQDRRTTLAVIAVEGDQGTVEEAVPELRERLEGLAAEHQVTGLPALNYDIRVTSEEDLRRSEVFTIPIILILLLVVFRTIIASAIPLILGAASVVTAVAALYLIGSAIDTSIFALNVASMIGLGLAIDFCLIVISRFREELTAGGRDPRDKAAVR